MRRLRISFAPRANRRRRSALVGLGVQLFAVTSCILVLSLFGIYYPNNGGTMYTSIITIYALTSVRSSSAPRAAPSPVAPRLQVIGGFVSGRLYAQMGGVAWAWNLVAQVRRPLHVDSSRLANQHNRAQATLFTVPFFCVVFRLHKSLSSSSRVARTLTRSSIAASTCLPGAVMRRRRCRSRQCSSCSSSGALRRSSLVPTQRSARDRQVLCRRAALRARRHRWQGA